MTSLWPSWNRTRSPVRDGRRHFLGRSVRGEPTKRLQTGVTRIRDAFRVEALEPRVLLSADPLLAPLKTFFLPEDRAVQDLLQEVPLSSQESGTYSSFDTLQGALQSAPAQSLLASPALNGLVPMTSGQQSASALTVDAQVPDSVVFSPSGINIFEGTATESLSSGAEVFSDAVRVFGEAAEATQDATAQPWVLSLPSTQPVDALLEPAPSPTLNLLQSGAHDLALLGDLAGSGALWVAPDAALKGSGYFIGDLTVEGMLSPGYSPGVQNVSNLTLTSSATTVFEIGGNTAGTGSGFYDQINVSGLASLDGTLQIALIDGFRPQDGQVFNVLNFGSYSGAFAQGLGLIDAGNGVFFEVQAQDQAINLKAHVLDDSLTYILGALVPNVGADQAALQDQLGSWLNFDYFQNNSSFSFSGDFSLGQGLSLSGTASIGFANHVLVDGEYVDVFSFGFDNATGYLGLDVSDSNALGLAASDADVAVLFMRSEDPLRDLGWIWAEGSAGGLSLLGGGDVTLTATEMALDFALALGSDGGAANTRMLDLSGGPRSVNVGASSYLFDDSDTAQRAALSGNVVLGVDSLVSLSGTMGFASSSQRLVVAGEGIEARFSAGGVDAGVNNGSLGLVLNADNSYLLEASGALYLSGGDFASVSASNATLRLNTTGLAQAQQVLQVGDYTHTLSAMSALADPVLHITALQARLGDSLSLAGDFAFERDASTGELQVLANAASASVRAGGMHAGVSDAQIALVISNDPANGGIVLQASGAADLVLGDAVQMSADAVSVQWNSTTADATPLATSKPVDRRWP